MTYSACRKRRIFGILSSIMILYSLTCPIIANDDTQPTDTAFRNRITLTAPPEPEAYISSQPPTSVIAPQNATPFQASASDTDSHLPVSFDKNKKTEYVLKGSLSYTEEPGQEAKFLSEKTWNSVVKGKYRNGLIKTIAKGAKYIHMRRYIGSGLQNINILEINQGINSHLEVRPGFPHTTINHKATVNTIIHRNNALAGVNASFFKQTTGTPLGTLIVDKELVTGPIFNRVTMGIDDSGYKMDKISFNGKLTLADKSEITVDNINQPRMLSSYTLVYTYRWGKMSPPSPKYGIQVAIENNKVVAVSKEQLRIPTTGYVIVGPQSKLGKLKVEDDAKVSFYSNPEWENVKFAFSGGPYLVKNGNVYVDAAEQKMLGIVGKNPRTAVGYTRDNRLIIITIDGRQRASSGVTLYELAKLMKEFGCYNAMNLDGGTSTQMVVKNRVVNYPLNKGGSYISNALILKLQ